MSLDGLLVVDKPVGPTSHDVVSRVRRAIREPRIGHTGTLDPLASGVLLLLIGRATRLAQFLTADAKRYEATMQLGVSTDTYDALGQPTSVVHEGAWPSRRQVEDALEPFRGTFAQQPPAFSAKKIAGRRSYRLARAHRRARLADAPAVPAVPAVPASPALPAPTSVTVSSLDIVRLQDQVITIDIECSSGFYVRSLAHDLGAALGVGAHLSALRRTEASGRRLADALPLAAIEEAGGADRVREVLVPLADVLSGFQRLTLTDAGVRRAVSGCDLETRDFSLDLATETAPPLPERVRLLDGAANLVGIADRTAAGLLHPVVVLM